MDFPRSRASSSANARELGEAVVSPAEVEALLARPGVVILDLPTVWEDHHLPGA
jgi:hypothetical protein